MAVPRKWIWFPGESLIEQIFLFLCTLSFLSQLSLSCPCEYLWEFNFGPMTDAWDSCVFIPLGTHTTIEYTVVSDSASCKQCQRERESTGSKEVECNCGESLSSACTGVYPPKFRGVSFNGVKVGAAGKVFLHSKILRTISRNLIKERPTVYAVQTMIGRESLKGTFEYMVQSFVSKSSACLCFVRQSIGESVISQ